jgi:hypothetical protein
VSFILAETGETGGREALVAILAEPFATIRPPPGCPAISCAFRTTPICSTVSSIWPGRVTDDQAGLAGCGKSPPWPFSARENSGKAKVFQVLDRRIQRRMTLSTGC